MVSKYEPELGQFIFGTSYSEFEAPEFIIAGLKYLSDEIERVMWNNNQEEYNSPINNNGGTYKTNVFEINAYYWGDDKELQERPNFKCGDFEVRWYKYCGRGTTINRKINANEYFEMIDKCLKSVRDTEEINQ